MSLVPTRQERPDALAPFARFGRSSGFSAVSGAAGGARMGGGGFSGKDFLRVIRHRKWLILLSLFVFVLVSFFGTVLWARFAPTYTATALLHVNPPKATMLGGRTGLLPVKATIELLMQDKISSIKRDSIMRKVLDSNTVRETQWYQKRSHLETRIVLDKLMEAVNVGAIRDTRYLTISVKGENPQDIANIASEVAKIAVQEATAASDSAHGIDLQGLNQQIQNWTQKRNEAWDRIKALHKMGVGVTGGADEGIGEEQSTLLFRQEALVRELIQVQQDYISATQSREAIRQMSDKELRQLEDVRRILEYHQILQSLRGQILGLEQSLDHVRNKFGENHQRVRDVTRNLDTVRNQLEQKENEIAAQTIADIKAAQDMLVQSLTARFLSLRSDIQKIEIKLQAIDVKIAEREALEIELARAEGYLKMLTTQIMDLRLLMKSEHPLRLDQEAVPPDKSRPTWPRYSVMVPMGTLLGLVFGMGLAFLLEMVNTTIRGPEDLTRKVDCTVLGMIPHIDDIDEEIADARLAFLTAPQTLFNEAFRSVWTTLLSSTSPDGRGSILITSPMPEDGRTTVALNLAHVLAVGGKKVLVVDANFRQPVIRNLFPTCPDGGLSGVLSEQGDWEDQVLEIEPGVSVMASGPIPSNPSELLGGDTMRRLVVEMSDAFDQVIFDGPPCMVVLSDACSLSTLVDGTIIVARAEVSTYGVVQRCCQMFLRIGSRNLGVVLNGARATAGGYLKKNLDMFYEYQQSRLLPSSPVLTPDSGPPNLPNDFDSQQDEPTPDSYSDES